MLKLNYTFWGEGGGRKRRRITVPFIMKEHFGAVYQELHGERYFHTGDTQMANGIATPDSLDIETTNNNSAVFCINIKKKVQHR